MKSKMKTIIICKLLLFFQYSQINREFFEAQSKLSNQGLREELKLEFPKTFGNSLSFVNLKNEHTQGVFVNMTTKQTQSVSLFSNAGDILSNDGWSSTWAIESGYTWAGSLSVWQKWGNGKKEGTETWDDGNTANSDGWSSSWAVESGWTWSAANPSVWQKCGNGIKEGSETCDDSNTADNDGWSSL